MSGDILKKREKDISAVLLIGAGLMAFLSAGKVIGMVTARTLADTLLEKAVTEYNAAGVAEDKYLEEAKKIAADLKKKNLFVPPPQKRNPVQAVTGILGDEALIGNKWYKVGDKVGDAEIKEIEPTQVKVAWDGKETWFAPMTAMPPVPNGNAPMLRPDRGDSRRARAGRGEGGMGPRGMRGGFMGLSEEDVARMRERRAQWENASEAEREQMRQQFREQFGGGRGGRRGRGD